MNPNEEEMWREEIREVDWRDYDKWLDTHSHWWQNQDQSNWINKVEKENVSSDS